MKLLELGGEVWGCRRGLVSRSSRRCKSLCRYTEGFQKGRKDSQKGRKRKRAEKEKEKGL
jgi:hypothetical protein